jgi:hypothetical protein
MPIATGSRVGRRYAVGMLSVGAAGLAMPVRAQARPITQRGMVGGGLAKFDESEAQFSIFASRITVDDQDEGVVVGSILWVDKGAGYSFASTEVTNYENLEVPADQGEARRIRGTMRVNEGEEYPFLLNVTDAGLPGSGLDTVALIVGSGAEAEAGATPVASEGFSYAAAGPIEDGDLHDVDLEFSLGPGAS